MVNFKVLISRPLDGGDKWNVKRPAMMANASFETCTSLAQQRRCVCVWIGLESEWAITVGRWTSAALQTSADWNEDKSRLPLERSEHRLCDWWCRPISWMEPLTSLGVLLHVLLLLPLCDGGGCIDSGRTGGCCWLLSGRKAPGRRLPRRPQLSLNTSQ